MKINNETKIGMMISIVVVILVTLTVKTGNFNFSQEGYIVKVLFQTIEGVDVNAPVMLNGLEVGVVKEIEIVEKEQSTLMELSVWLKQEAKLKEGTKAYVKNMGFMGEKYIGLTSGKSVTYLPEGSVIVGENPVDLDTLLLDGQQIATNIKEITGNLNERLTLNKQYIDTIFKNLDATMGNMVSITDNVDERLVTNQKYIDEMIVNLHSSTINLDQFTYDLKMHPWKLMYRTKEKRMKNIEEGDL